MPGFPCRILAFGALLLFLLVTSSATTALCPADTILNLVPNDSNFLDETFTFPLNVKVEPGRNGEPLPPLVRVVPDDAGIIVGMKGHNAQAENREFFVPIPGNSIRDYDYFRSLCGADPAKTIEEVIFADSDSAQAEYAHTLIARGRFNTEKLYRSAINSGAGREDYRGLHVLRVPPLSRERNQFSEITWLAIIDSRFLLLGTPEYVRLEIDRLIGDNLANTSLARQFSIVAGSDVWWIVRKAYDTSMIKRALLKLSPELAAAMDHTGLCVGTRYGSKVEFIYQIDASSPTQPAEMSPSPRQGGMNVVAEGNSLMRGSVKVSRSQYRRWVSDISSNIHSYR